MLNGVERVKDASSPNSESQTYESRRTRRGAENMRRRTKLKSDIGSDRRKQARMQQLHLAARHKVGHGGEKEARLNELRLIARRRLGLDPAPIEENKANDHPSPEQPQINMEVINNMKDGTLAAPQGCVHVPRVIDKILPMSLLPNEEDTTKKSVIQGPVASNLNLPKEIKASYVHPAVRKDSHFVSDVISGHGHFDSTLFGQGVAETICQEISATTRASHDLTSNESDQDGDTKVKETNIRAVIPLEAQWKDRGGKSQDKISVDRKIFCANPDESEPLVSHSTKSEIFKADKFLPSTGHFQEDGSGHFDNTSSGQGVAETICQEISVPTQASRDLTSSKNYQDGNTKVEQKNIHIVVQSMAQYKDGGEKAQGKISVERKILYTDPGGGEPLISHSIKSEILKDDRFIPSTGLVQANGSNNLCGAGCNPLKQYEGSRKKLVHERKDEGGSDFLRRKDLSAEQKNPAKKPRTRILHNQDDTSEGGEEKNSNERETTLRHPGDGSIDDLSISTNDTSESSIEGVQTLMFQCEKDLLKQKSAESKAVALAKAASVEAEQAELVFLRSRESLMNITSGPDAAKAVVCDAIARERIAIQKAVEASQSVTKNTLELDEASKELREDNGASKASTSTQGEIVMDVNKVKKHHMDHQSDQKEGSMSKFHSELGNNEHIECDKEAIISEEIKERLTKEYAKKYEERIKNVDRLKSTDDKSNGCVSSSAPIFSSGGNQDCVHYFHTKSDENNNMLVSVKNEENKNENKEIGKSPVLSAAKIATPDQSGCLSFENTESHCEDWIMPAKPLTIQGMLDKDGLYSDVDSSEKDDKKNVFVDPKESTPTNQVERMQTSGMNSMNEVPLQSDSRDQHKTFEEVLLFESIMEETLKSIETTVGGPINTLVAVFQENPEVDKNNREDNKEKEDIKAISELQLPPPKMILNSSSVVTSLSKTNTFKQEQVYCRKSTNRENLEEALSFKSVMGEALENIQYGVGTSMVTLVAPLQELVDMFRKEEIAVPKEEMSVIEWKKAVEDSWSLYSEVCWFLICRWKYDDTFQKIQSDPLYAYFNSLKGVNDVCDDKLDHEVKSIIQLSSPKYQKMTKTEICEDLITKAKEVQPSLVKLCKSLARVLKIRTLGVGPIKDTATAMEKAESKYSGNLLKVTDFCRAFMVVNDIATLLALFETIDSIGAKTCRVKISNLKSGSDALSSGYRDCKINVLIEGHICEIQIHLEKMWKVCYVHGYTNYKKGCKNSMDNQEDPYDTLNGIDDQTLSDLISMGKQAVAGTSLLLLEKGIDDKLICDHYAMVGLFLKKGDFLSAEKILIALLLLLRLHWDEICLLYSEGLRHHLETSLQSALRLQGLADRSNMIGMDFCRDANKGKKKSIWSSLQNPKKILDSFIDPAKKDREYDLTKERKTLESKKLWMQKRQKRFKHINQKTMSADIALATLAYNF